MLNFIAAMLTAVGFGRAEKYTFDHGFQPGPPNFLTFNLNYHIWILLVALASCYAAGCLWATPLWVLVEDAAYFILNKNDNLDPTDWVTLGLGGFTLFGQFIPYTYVGLVALSIVLAILL